MIVLIVTMFWITNSKADNSNGEFDLNVINKVLEEAKKFEGVIDLNNKHKEKGRTEVEKLAEFFSSDGYQRLIRQKTEELKQTIFKDRINNVTNQSAKEIDKNSRLLKEKEELYLFISSSIPIHTLRNYTVALDKLGSTNISVVMRGFTGGMKYIKPTIHFVTNIIKKDESCDFSKEKCDLYKVSIKVDPLLFRKYKITQVPAVVFEPGVDSKISAYYVVYGDASLEYLLEMIYRETKSGSIDKMILALK